MEGSLHQLPARGQEGTTEAGSMSDSKIAWTDARPVPGWLGYRVASDGTLFGPRGPVRWQPQPSGHLVYVTGKRRLRAAHAVLSAFVGPRPPGLISRHLNDVPSDNRVENLRWGTYGDNTADALRNGRILTGTQAAGATLDAESVAMVRASSLSSRCLGALLGVSHTTIQKVRRQERYRCG